MEKIAWEKLGFGYTKTAYNVRCVWRDGKWGKIEVTDSEYVTVHMAATCLHYGQSAFEGLKAYACKDGKVRLFRVDQNAKRMQSSADYISMQAPSVELFTEMVEMAVKANREFIPPYGTGASLYIRPVLFGTGESVGVRPADEFTIIIFVTPVGPYFKNGFKPIKTVLEHVYDRAAPRGTGHVKVGGNYAASLEVGTKAHEAGYANVLYLDPRTKQHIDEFGAANFFAIRKGCYITPDSHSVLPSITNMSLKEIAADLGLKVEVRPVDVTELPTFEEVGACGTAAVISPVYEIADPDKGTAYHYGSPDVAGEWSTRLYKRLTDIQYGETEDTHGWTRIVEM